MKFTYYKPAGDSTAERVAMVEKAADEDYNVIVMPGFAFGETITQVADVYPDISRRTGCRRHTRRWRPRPAHRRRRPRPGRSVEYVYGNQFFGDPDITAYADNWYQNLGVQAVFACGGAR